MDAIESLDWGVVNNFAFTLNSYPTLMLLFQPAYYFGSYPADGVIVLLAVVLFLWQRNYRVHWRPWFASPWPSHFSKRRSSWCRAVARKTRRRFSGRMACSAAIRRASCSSWSA